MLFNSLPFLFGFLPATLTAFYVLSRIGQRWAGLSLVAASLFFYGWWNVSFLGLLAGSAIFNYWAGLLIASRLKNSRATAGVALAVAILADISVLGYFKYAGFFGQIANALFGTAHSWAAPILPLGISFFTFTQIAFLVDAWQGKVREPSFLHYVLFVTYFPHLIAGPILHHGEIMPQFADRRTFQIDWKNIAAGLTFFAVGLAKKVLVADGFATFANPVFSGIQQGGHAPLIEAWSGALAYTLQLYFDFSGYSDMAIGLSLFFNVKLPLNFNSPYKSSDIVDFWRRWHMTLSRFLRDYLYIPLGGNRKGTARRYLNLIVTMLLGGLWHGAGWTYVVWGGLHGLYLAINHAFRAFRRLVGWPDHRFGAIGAVGGCALTFTCVVAGWVFFRSANFYSAAVMLEGMAGAFGVRGADNLAFPLSFPVTGVPGREVLALLAVGLAMVWLLPNTQEFVRAGELVLGKIDPPRGIAGKIRWNAARWWSWTAIGLLLARSIWQLSPSAVSQFLYYQF